MACNGRCFGYQCKECDEAVYRDDFDKAMHDQIETNFNDELYEYEEDK